MNTRRFAQRAAMHASLLAALAVLPGTAALAQSRAVQAVNYELGMSAREIDTDDSTSNGTLGVRAGANVPLGRYLGASLVADYSRSTIRTRSVLENPDGSLAGTRPTCRFDRTGADALLFARLPGYGRVGVGYGIGSISPDCGDSSVFIGKDTGDLSTEALRVEAEYYLGNFTLAAARTTTDLDQGEKLTSNSFAVSWYPLDSLRISLLGNDLYEQDTYGIELEHQPEFLGDALTVRVGYSVRDEDQRVSTISFGLGWHFGTRVPLKTRDREYR